MKSILELSYLPHQMKVFDSDARHVVYVKGRRTGGTKGASMRLMEMTFKQSATTHLWIDTSLRNIDKVVARYFLPMLRHLPHRWNKTNRVLHFMDNAYCDFGSAERPHTLEGFAYDCIWINEAGLVLKNEDLYYHTLLPMLLESSNTRLFCIGAPKGGGLFQRMYEWGQDPAKKDWISYQHSSFYNPLLPRAQLAHLRTIMPEHVYRQEILAEFFQGSQAVFHGIDNIITAQPPQPVPKPTGVYVLGIDLARYHDATVIWVGDVEQCTGVFCERFQRIPWQAQITRIANIAKRFHHAIAYVDATGVGDPICEALREKEVIVNPVHLTHGRKQNLIENLALGIEQQMFKVVDHPQTIAELRCFQFETLPSGLVRCSAPSGQHDDCVIALALCYWGMSAYKNTFIWGNPMESTVDGI